MNKVLELFGHSTYWPNLDWQNIVKEQQCPFLGKKCFKIRKSNPDDAIGTCNVLYGKEERPILICPARLIEKHQIFIDCLHLLTVHEPGNELHIVPEVSVPGGSVDYFMISACSGKVKDFVGIELQTLDTTGTVWPERQRLLRELGVQRSDDGENLQKSFGMNWKMTAKTILVQIHHKIQTFEYVNKKLVLIVQDYLLDYMQQEFSFSHLRSHASIGDSMHIHSYCVEKKKDDSFKISLDTRHSTDAEGIKICLGLQSEPQIKLSHIISTLEQKISPKTLFIPMARPPDFGSSL